MWSRSVEEAIIQENTDFFDTEFRKSYHLMNISRDEEGYSLLHSAVKHSTERMVKYFLDKGISSSICTTIKRETALHVAVKHYNYSIVELLLNYGCPIDGVDNKCHTPLYRAAEIYGKFYVSSCPQPDVIGHLLHRGADVNAGISFFIHTPLFQAIEHGSAFLVRLFVGQGANINHRDIIGLNALHYAAGRRDLVRLVEILLDAGAEVNSLTRDGSTALHMSASTALCEKTVDLLIERGAMVNAVDEKGKTPIFLAVAGNVDEDDDDDNDQDRHDEATGKVSEEYKQMLKRVHNITRSLLDAGAHVNHISYSGEPAFHQAIMSGIESVAELFLERGADVHCRNADGCSTLHIAIEYASEKIVETLIDRGVPIDVRSSIGATPLHLAVQFGMDTHIKLLLARGAYVNVIDVNGYTPLHYAARLEDGQDEHTIKNIVEDILLNNDADPFIRSNDDKTPLDYAVAMSNASMIKVLLLHLAYLDSMGDSRASEVAMRGIGNVDHRLQIYEKRKRDIVSMRQEMIYGNISYFDILMTSDLDRLALNVEFVRAFKYNQVIRTFDYYEKMVEAIDHAVYRKNLNEMATEYLFALFSDFKLSIPILETILKHYKLEELEKFIQSCQETEL